MIIQPNMKKHNQPFKRKTKPHPQPHENIEKTLKKKPLKRKLHKTKWDKVHVKCVLYLIASCSWRVSSIMKHEGLQVGSLFKVCSFNINSHCIKSNFIYQLVIIDVIGKPWQWCSNTIKVKRWYRCTLLPKISSMKKFHYIQILTTKQFAMVFVCQLWKVSPLFCFSLARRKHFHNVPKSTYAHSCGH